MSISVELLLKICTVIKIKIFSLTLYNVFYINANLNYITVKRYIFPKKSLKCCQHFYILDIFFKIMFMLYIFSYVIKKVKVYLISVRN